MARQKSVCSRCQLVAPVCHSIHALVTVSDTTRSLVVAESPTIGIPASVLGIIGFAGYGAYLMVSGRGALREIAGALVATMMLVLLLGMLESTRFEFDPETRKVFWRRWRLFRTEKGSLPFERITGIVLESHESGSADAYRLALRTPDATVPITNGFSKSRSQQQALAQRVQAVLTSGRL
jgi:hypothetical protein